MGGEFGGDWIHVYVWLSIFTVDLTALLISYTPIQSKGVKKKKKTTRKSDVIATKTVHKYYDLLAPGKHMIELHFTILKLVMTM